MQAEEARQLRQQASERVREVERDGSRVLRAERMQRGGEEVYRLKVLTPEGRVRVLHDGRDRNSRPEMRSDRRSLLLRDRARRPDPRTQREAELPRGPGGRALPQDIEPEPPSPRRRGGPV